MEKRAALMMNPLKLAYVGDTVYDLAVRTMVINSTDAPMNDVNKKASSIVNARAQSMAAGRLESIFTEDEEYVFRRGRNAKSATVPKNMEVSDYRRATGLEAVIGFLYLTEEWDRLKELFKVILDEK